MLFEAKNPHGHHHFFKRIGRMIGRADFT